MSSNIVPFIAPSEPFDKPAPPINKADMPPSLMMVPVQREDLFTCVKTVCSYQESGLTRIAPVQPTAWGFSPVYRDSTPTLIDAKTGKAYARTGDELLQPLPKNVLDHILGLELPDEIRWLHTARVLGLSNLNPAGVAVLIYDIIMPGVQLSDRLDYLDKILVPQIGFRQPLEVDRVYAVPTFAESDADDLWAALHLTNQIMSPSGGGPYTGILARELSSTYKIQNDDYRKPSLAWHYHPFIHAQ